MKRRDFVLAAGALGLGSLSFKTQSQTRLRFADMHTHAARRPGRLRDNMRKGGVLLIAEKVIPDLPLLPRERGVRLGATRPARPGEMRASFEEQWRRVKGLLKAEELVEVASLEALDRALRDSTPGAVLSSEGADFLEGDLDFLAKMRADGLAHLQLVHYRVSDVGDISTEAPAHGGLTAFGKDVVRACNRLGILVDIAHCSVAGMEHALELSNRPVVYSHGYVSGEVPNPLGRNGRAIHLPMARRVAEKGGVVGIWPLGFMYGNRAVWADAIARFAEQIGPAHIGIGSDINGLPSTVLPTHEDFGELEDLLRKIGLKAPEIEGILGGNYIRVLREAMKT
jgi:membrane dipeptidase